MGHTALRLRLKRRGQSGMLMGARPNSCRQTHLNHQNPHPAAHGSHLTANKVPNSRERSRFRGIEESDRTTEVKKKKEIAKNALGRVGKVFAMVEMKSKNKCKGVLEQWPPIHTVG
ncbi:hypothetical protein ElyMa_000236100 [Elysia marginata]|uniref:Uncharacterized protein n=1 Tax=Elysia marginata TaxID=1093978 RepID=A0AAV4F245_9GAST|nr:hypothetical protein ElyMa_000236100 [Elysia marginata]